MAYKQTLSLNSRPWTKTISCVQQQSTTKTQLIIYTQNLVNSFTHYRLHSPYRTRRERIIASVWLDIYVCVCVYNILYIALRTISTAIISLNVANIHSQWNNVSVLWLWMSGPCSVENLYEIENKRLLRNIRNVPRGSIMDRSRDFLLNLCNLLWKSIDIVILALTAVTTAAAAAVVAASTEYKHICG